MASPPGAHSKFSDPNYESIQVIGKGSFGHAVLVRSKKDGQKYISKQVNMATMSQKDRDAAQNEVDVLVKVKHPCIIRYIEHYIREEILYIIMEYADGGDLLRRVQDRKKDPSGIRFSEDQVMAWFIQMALAVNHMHDNKILHRDLKSANIFLTKDDIVKIGVFGFGKILNNSIAQAKTLCGTPYYFSPELCMGRPYNNKSDVWALGCILAEMCCLGHAYDAKNIKDLMKRVTKGTYQPIPPCYCEPLHQLIAYILTKDQAQRPNIKQVLESDYVQRKFHQLAQGKPDLYNSAAMGMFGTSLDSSPGDHGGSPSTQPGDMQSTSVQRRKLLPAKEKKSHRSCGELEEPKEDESAARFAAMKVASGSRKQLKEFIQGPPPVDDGTATPAFLQDEATSSNASPPAKKSSAPAEKPAKVPAWLEPVTEIRDSNVGPSDASPGRQPVAGRRAVGGKEQGWQTIEKRMKGEDDNLMVASTMACAGDVGDSLMDRNNSMPYDSSDVILNAGKGKPGGATTSVGRQPSGTTPAKHGRRQLEEDDFGDPEAPLSCNNIRTLLVSDLGQARFDQVYKICTHHEDDEETAVQRINQVLGGNSAREIAALVFKLILTEREGDM